MQDGGPQGLQQSTDLERWVSEGGWLVDLLLPSTDAGVAGQAVVLASLFAVLYRPARRRSPTVVGRRGRVHRRPVRPAWLALSHFGQLAALDVRDTLAAQDALPSRNVFARAIGDLVAEVAALS